MVDEPAQPVDQPVLEQPPAENAAVEQMASSPPVAEIPEVDQPPVDEQTIEVPPEWQALRWLWPLVLVAAVFVTFGQSLDFGFLSWDDDLHVTENARLNPLTWDSYLSFWREPYEFLYIPISYTLFAGEVALSHLIHGARGAVDPQLFHAVSLLLHAGNVLLVFALLRRWDHDPAAACAGALVFALHPLQVESVAWISEQRGLLSAVLSLAALWFYSRGETSSWRTYTLASLCFVLAMLAKPSAVAVPLMALAIDRGLLDRRLTFSALRLLPWLGLSAVVMWFTREEQALAHIEYMPTWSERFWIAADAAGWYVAKVFWPFGFSFDPGRPARMVAEQVVTEYSVYSLMPILLAALAMSVRQRILAAAAFISLAGFLPVLGFIPFAFQNTSTVADRYAYLPLLGVALAVSHMLAGSLSLVRWVPAVAAIGAAAWLSFVQTGAWGDNLTLYNHGLSVNARSWTAHHQLGNLYHRRGMYEPAREHFTAALEIKPNDAISLTNLGTMYLEEGNNVEAEQYLRRAVVAAPWDSAAHANLGNLLSQTGRRDEAITEYELAIQKKPTNSHARVSFASVLMQAGRLDEALAQADAAVANHPHFALTHLARANVLMRQEKLDAAIEAAKLALESDRNMARAHELLGNIAYLRERFDTALDEYDQALSLDGRLVEASYNRGLVLIAIGSKAAGLEQLKRALLLVPPDSPLTTVIRDAIQQHEGK